jgi:LPXTG-motif cell wall-anchored protein
MATGANLVRGAALVAISAVVAVEPAFAGVTPVPGPLLAAGAPALALLAGGYYLIRKRRSR